MAKAIEAGLPKLRIEEAAAKTQARIDAGAQSVIGVNKYRPDDEAPIDVLKVDNSAVRQLQIDKLARLKARARRSAPSARRSRRSPARPRAATAICWRSRSTRRAPRRRSARSRWRWRRCSAAIVAEIKAISGVYKREAGAMIGDAVERVLKQVAAFEADEGRRPRILVAKIGQDGHDRGQKVIASAFADLGFDVDIGPLFATPARRRARRSRTTCTSSASPRSPPAI